MEAPVEAPVEDYLQEILRGFVTEAGAYLAGLRTLLARGAQGATGEDDLAEGYRLLHSLHGASSMLGLADLGDSAAVGEALLGEIAGGRPFDAAARELLGATVARLTEALESVSAGLLPGAGAAPAPIDAGREELPEPPVESLEESPEGAWEEPAAASLPPFSAADLPAMVLPDDLVAGFYEEAEEHLGAIGAALRELERDPAAGEALREVRRRAHTLKGAASMMGLTAIARVCHGLEDAFEQRTADLPAIQVAVDTLEDLVRRPAPAAATETAPAPGMAAGRTSGPAAAGPSGPRRTAAEEGVRVPLQRIDELVRVASELLVERSVFERAYEDLTRQAGELALSLRRLRGLTDRLDGDYEATALMRGRPGAPVEPAGPVDGSPEFDELEMDRYTGFHQLTRSLAETVSDVETVGAELAVTSTDFEAFILRQKRLVRELQEGLLGLRAVPVATLASRLLRAARNAAERTGKSVELTLVGEAVELDKNLLEQIVDPLLHLVRNAVDHGIELPAVRRERGKPERGSLVIAARHQGGQVVFEISDDGGGLDLAGVRAAAVARGLVPPEVGAALSDEEARELLFLPGFTTAQAVSEISGRGIGLDVVRSRVASLRGVVALDSTPGGGTRFTLRLPLTLAITRALLVRVAGRILALPAAGVERVARIDRGEVHHEAEHAWITLEGEELPVRALADVLTLRGTEEAAAARPLAVVIDLGDHREAFLVDALIESREVVVKPLGPMLRRVAGLAGATLLGDGSVVPILDPYTLPERKLAPPTFVQDRPAVTTLIPWRLEVMIVDDSLSVRRVLSNLAVNAGWLPSTARDGLEALELLQRRSHPPDVLLLDVEMPRMDGYELAATLRAQAAYASLPIVMITSRAGAKHREKAFASGVSQYLVKPFDPEVLINLVERLTAVGPVQRHSALLPPSPPAASPP